jgi:toxin ParE1/3/4
VGQFWREITPESGSVLGGNQQLYSYRILYEIKPTHIDVLAVIHKRRDLQPDEIPRGQ